MKNGIWTHYLIPDHRGLIDIQRHQKPSISIRRVLCITLLINYFVMNLLIIIVSSLNDAIYTANKGSKKVCLAEKQRGK